MNHLSLLLLLSIALCFLLVVSLSGVGVDATEYEFDELDDKFENGDDDGSGDDDGDASAEEKYSSFEVGPEFSGLDVKPVAYFPLEHGDLTSQPGEKYEGSIVGGERGVFWGPKDDVFPYALSCQEKANGLVQLDSVPYGTKGDFSINLWMKQKPRKLMQGDDPLSVQKFEYIFSHSTTNQESEAFFPWGPSQIHLYVPTVASPAHGVIRAIVKDSSNEYEGPMSETFLDSDGRFMDNYGRNIPGHVDLEDDKWHMITLTSEGDGKKGYRMYVDGVLAGEAPPSVILQQLSSSLTEIPGIYVDGGEPLKLNGTIHLCGRVDKDADRHFGGSLSHLSLWDDVLSNEQVAKMYSTVMGDEKLKQRCIDAAASELQAIDKIELCPFLDLAKPKPLRTSQKVTESKSGVPDERTGTGKKTTLSDVLRDTPLVPSEAKAVTISKRKPCTVLQVPSECGQDAICIPSKALDELSKDGSTSDEDWSKGSEGECVDAPVGGVFPPDPTIDVPMPLVFYPLTGESVDSWPLGRFEGEATDVEWTPDVLFENTIKCSEQKGGYVKLPNVKYGKDGQFAVNFWMKKETSGPTSEGGFEYIFSHGQKSGDNFNPFAPNNVHVYLPEVAHPAHGVARVIVKDSLSEYKGLLSHTFFDSDGKFMDNSPRNTIGHVNLEDGNWHMFTLSTKSNGDAGYQVFVDGTLGGSFPTPEVQNFLDKNQNGNLAVPLLHVDGGNPMDMEGEIYLCGRADLASERHFDGQLAHLEIFDESLTQEMVEAMYTAVMGQSLLLDSISDLASSIRAMQPEVSQGMPQYISTLRSSDIINALRDQKGASSDKTEKKELKALISELRSGDTIPCSIDVAKSGIVTPIGCEKEGLVCAALHEDLAKGKDNGICVESPEGGAYVPSPKTELPIPKAYFPLTGGSVESWPEPKYGGRKMEGLKWVKDDLFGSVLECSEERRDYVELDNVDYGIDGPFTVNLWMSHNGSSGDTFEFLFSHGNNDLDAKPWSPNEVQIYLPEVAHPAHGVVRTIVKDSNDVYEGPLSQTYLDSDGGFMNNMPRNVPGHVDLTDGKWHMITLTTRPDGSPGFSVYVDGVLGGTSPPAFIKQLQTDIPVDGGDPVKIDSNIYLCGRNDLDKDRHFGGKLAHLSLFDEALTGSQVMALYVAAAGEAAAMQRTMSLILSQIQGTAGADTLLGSLNRAKVGEACYIRDPDATLEERLYQNAMEENKRCVDGAVCSPKANSPVMLNNSTTNMQFAQFLHGQCVEVPQSDMLPELESHDGAMFFPNPLVNVPTPMAFFPLTAGKVDSWPGKQYGGMKRGAQWVQDDLFGQVLSCDDEDNGFISLDPVPYAEDGPFTVNFWIKNKDASGSTFEYVYSHAGDDDNGFNPFYPNQIQIYMPEVSHPAHGVIRTIVKDSSDVYQGKQSELWLDSDGWLGNNKERDTPGHVDLTDGDWHMVTLTTRTKDREGYAIFVDGVLGGANFLPHKDEDTKSGNARGDVDLDGGMPMRLDGSIYLCGRNDLHPERHFKGKLTHLSLFDTSLTPPQIAELFMSVKGEQAYLKRLNEIAAAETEREEIRIRPPVPEPRDDLQIKDAPKEEKKKEKKEKKKKEKEKKEKEEDIKSKLKAALESTRGKVKGFFDDVKDKTTKIYTKADTKTALGAGVGIGLLVAVVAVGVVIGGIIFARKRKAAKERGIQLPTVSRTPSVMVPTGCISPDGSSRDATPASDAGSTNPLRTAQIKMEHKKLSKYTEME